MPILTKRMEKYLSKEDKRGLNKSMYNSRIRKYAIQGLEDLALLAGRLAEKQLREIFNEETLRAFFEALLKIEISAEDHEDWKRIKETEETLAKRKRLVKICQMILMLMGDYNFTASLVPSNWKPWLTGGYPPINNLKAILYAQPI